jgi:Spy/CpxP family protein refolding chaperone
VNAWKIVCATLVIFIAGIITGAVLVRLGERPKPWARQPREFANRSLTNIAGQFNPLPNQLNRPNNPNPPANPGNPNSGPMGREFVAALERELRLTPEQREQVNKLMREGQERIRVLRQNIDPEVRQEMQRTHEQIQALLTPEQREQFLSLMKQRFQRRPDASGPPERRGRESRDPGGPQEFRDRRNPPPPQDDARNTQPAPPLHEP